MVLNTDKYFKHNGRDHDFIYCFFLLKKNSLWDLEDNYSKALSNVCAIVTFFSSKDNTDIRMKRYYNKNEITFFSL